jgi:DNA-binding SARP family transcriptional activator
VASPAPAPLERSVVFARPATTSANAFRLSVLGAFGLQDGDAIPLALPFGAQRLFALLAIRNRSVGRDAVAGTLWPDTSDQHAKASVRSLLTRLDAVSREALQVTALDLSLSTAVEVDLHAAQALAHRLLIIDLDATSSDLSHATIEALSSDLLPDWYEEWLVPEAAQWHELRLHALEALADKLASAERYADAIEALGVVLAADPVRETSYVALIQAHLAEGNRNAARLAFEQYSRALHAELGVTPSPQLSALLGAGDNRRESSVIRQVQTAAAGEGTTAFEVVATGISMEPSIRHGDKLLVSLDIAPQAGRVVVATHRDVWIVKRLVLRDGALVLRSDNVDEEVALADVEIKGVVVEIRRTI